MIQSYKIDKYFSNKIFLIKSLHKINNHAILFTRYKKFNISWELKRPHLSTEGHFCPKWYLNVVFLYLKTAKSYEFLNKLVLN